MAELSWVADTKRLTPQDAVTVVLEREWGTGTAEDPGWIASDFATTCVVVALRNEASSRTCLAHVGSEDDAEPAVARMLERCRASPGALAAVYVGAFDIEGSGTLNETARAVERALESADVRVAGRCVGGANTEHAAATPQPHTRGLAVHFASGEARPVSLAHSLADVPHGGVRAAAFLYRPVPGAAPQQDTLRWVCATPQGPHFPTATLQCALERRVAEGLMRLPDSELLLSCSTSPAAEDTGFCDRVRTALAFALHHSTLELPPTASVP